MSFLTDKKTLLVGALSLFGGVTVSIFANQQSNEVPFFTQSANSVQITANAGYSSLKKSYIVQGGTKSTLVSEIENVGASILREFPIIGAVSAMLTDEQVDLLAANNLRVTQDREVRVMSSGFDTSNDLGSLLSTSELKKDIINTHITTQTEANRLHDMGIKGQGVTVAVLDSGTLKGGLIGRGLRTDSWGYRKDWPKYDATRSTMYYGLNDDRHGHGTHVSNIIGSSLKDEDGNFNGMAPDAYLLSVKAFDENGNGSYSDVLDGLNWIYQNHQSFGIRVLNLSLGAKVQSNYWHDPINQAVMRLWDAGIVVVTSAGNSGGDNATITVPGNVPYIITVGAATDSYSPYSYGDDRLTTFSSKGPTHEGFVKPELVAFGGHIEMKMDRSLLGQKQWFSSLAGEDYYGESGTSQAAAVVTGIVALMLDDNPWLTPDDVKCRLMASASPINNPATNERYSPFTQGSGLVNAYDATTSNATNCANQGLNIQADIAGIQHFKGPTVVDSNGELMIDFGNGNIIPEGSVWGGGTELEGSVWGGGTELEGSVWGGGTELEGSVWGGGTMLEGSVWGGGTVLEGSVWGGGTELEGSVWGGGTDLEGSVWGGGTDLEGSVWGGAGTSLESVELGMNTDLNGEG